MCVVFAFVKIWSLPDWFWLYIMHGVVAFHLNIVRYLDFGFNEKSADQQPD